MPRLWAVRAGGVVWGPGLPPPPLSEEGSALPPALVASLLSTLFSPRCGPSSSFTTRSREAGKEGIVASRGVLGSGERKAICEGHPLLPFTEPYL